MQVERPTSYKKISNTLLIILKDCDPYFGVKQSKQLKVVTNGTTIMAFFH